MIDFDEACQVLCGWCRHGCTAVKVPVHDTRTGERTATWSHYLKLLPPAYSWAEGTEANHVMHRDCGADLLRNAFTQDVPPAVSGGSAPKGAGADSGP